MHGSIAPFAVTKEPGGTALQPVDSFTVFPQPIGHPKQPAALELLVKRPALQGEQISSPPPTTLSTNFPAKQSEHPTLPCADDRPVPHATQFSAAVSFWYSLRPQNRQLMDAAKAACLPGMHGRQYGLPCSD